MRAMMTLKPAWRLAFGAMLLSFAPILVRATESPPTTSAFYRMLFGGLMLMTFLAVRRQSIAVGGRVALVLLAAGFAFAFDLFFWHRSIHLIGPGLATLLSGFQVFILAIVSVVFLGERLRWQIVIAIPTAFLGVALIIGIDWSALTEGYRMGVVFGLTTALCYSSYLLIMRWLRVNERSGVTPIVEVAWASLACAAVLAITSTVTGESLSIVSGSEAFLLFGYALFAILGLVIISWSLDKVPTSLVGLLLLLEPTFAYVWDLTLYDRPVSSLEIGGALLALGAIYLGSMKSSA
jgi:drug/metabolite transporter (DMT)-like permease